MSRSRSIEETFLACCQALRDAHTDFVIVGAFAVSVWGNPRTTQDVDIILAAEAPVENIVESFAKKDITLRAEDLRAAIREGSQVTAFDERSLFHVDLRPATDDDTKKTLDRAREIEFHGHEIPMASPEETIAHKLLFGSEQDIEDAESVYTRQADRLDEDQLRQRCRELGVEDDLQALVERLRDDPGS